MATGCEVKPEGLGRPINPEGPEGVAEQRYEVYEVVILPPLRGSFNIKPGKSMEWTEN